MKAIPISSGIKRVGNKNTLDTFETFLHIALEVVFSVLLCSCVLYTNTATDDDR